LQRRSADRRAFSYDPIAGFALRRSARVPDEVLRTDQNPRLDRGLPTITTKDRFALVTVYGEQYAIADIGMRMFASRELYRGQGFPTSTSSIRWLATNGPTAV
jgi:hypothetical protein